MNTTQQLAKQINEVFFGGNWTASNLKDVLEDVTWIDATTQVYSMNTIATLVYHISYFVMAANKVLEESKLDANDKYSFNHPPIQNNSDWRNLISKSLNSATRFANLINELPENKLKDVFVHEKYGTYHRNILGIIEHTHYHLGQIVLIKKLIKATN